MTLVSLFLVLIPVSFSTVPSSVILEVWGTVDDSTSSEKYSGTWIDCMSRCYWELTCVVISKTDSGCRLFRFGKVQSITVSDRIPGSELGIRKRSCPLDSATALKDSIETYQTDEVVYNYSINSTEVDGGRELKFTFEYFFQCPSGFLISVREAGKVCIGARFSESEPLCRNRTEAVSLCTEPGDAGLTGPYSTSEADVLASRFSSYCSAQYEYCNYWIDGYRIDNSQAINVTDSTLVDTSGYVWNIAPGSWQTGYDCVILGTRGGSPGKAYITLCSETNSPNWDYCHRGAMCRTDPIGVY